MMTDLSLCVISQCTFAEQTAAADILQNGICAGVPQPSRSAEIVRDSVIIAAVTFPIIILRIISRVWVTQQMWWDDWMIMIAAVLMIPNTGIPIYCAYHGFGKHFFTVPPPTLVTLEKLYYTATIFYALIQNFAKFSILLLYLRIFLTPRFRLIVKLAIGWMVCHTTAFVICVVLQCIPINSLWDLKVEGKCLNINALGLAGEGCSIVEDIVIMLLPISELKDLHTSFRKRLALCFMFAIGSFACVTSMIRMKIIWHYTNTLDGSWNNTDVMIWSEIETYTAVICSCLLCIRPLITKCSPSLMPSTRAMKSGEQNSSSPSWLQKVGTAASKLTSTISSPIVGAEPWDDEEGLWKGKTGRAEERDGSWVELRSRNQSVPLTGIRKEIVTTVIVNGPDDKSFYN